MSTTGRHLKNIERLLTIASGTTESDFKKDSQYMKFKTKKIINRTEVDQIIFGLDRLKFHEECIYWYKRVLDETVCNKDEHYEVLNSLCHNYFDIFEYEISLEYGNQALACMKASESIKSYRVSTKEFLLSLTNVKKH